MSSFETGDVCCLTLYRHFHMNLTPALGALLDRTKANQVKAAYSEPVESKTVTQEAK